VIPHADSSEPAAERLIAEQLLLQPLDERASRLLGQLAGILLLATAGTDPERPRAHLPALRARYAEVCATYRELAPPHHLGATFRAIGEALALIGGALDELDARAAAPLPMARLQAARRALQRGSRPALGIAPVDLASACCAGHGHARAG
jgi:hypothetical protein